MDQTTRLVTVPGGQSEVNQCKMNLGPRSKGSVVSTGRVLGCTQSLEDLSPVRRRKTLELEGP